MTFYEDCFSWDSDKEDLQHDLSMPLPDIFPLSDDLSELSTEGDQSIISFFYPEGSEAMDLWIAPEALPVQTAQEWIEEAHFKIAQFNATPAKKVMLPRMFTKPGCTKANDSDAVSVASFKKVMAPLRKISRSVPAKRKARSQPRRRSVRKSPILDELRARWVQRYGISNETVETSVHKKKSVRKSKPASRKRRLSSTASSTSKPIIKRAKFVSTHATSQRRILGEKQLGLQTHEDSLVVKRSRMLGRSPSLDGPAATKGQDMKGVNSIAPRISSKALLLDFHASPTGIKGSYTKSTSFPSSFRSLQMEGKEDMLPSIMC